MDYETLSTELGAPAAIAALITKGCWFENVQMNTGREGAMDVKIYMHGMYVTFHVASDAADTTVSWAEQDGHSDFRFILTSESVTGNAFEQLMELIGWESDDLGFKAKIESINFDWEDYE